MIDDKKSTDAYAEHDSFWDLDSVIPTRRRITPASKAHTEPVEIEIEAQEESKSSISPPEPISKRETVIRRFVRTGGEDTESRRLCESGYSPDISLIHKVRVYGWSAPYRYYESFVRMARFYDNKTAERCDAVEFFSYIPQYSQMNNRQLRYYLYVREQIKHGVYPDIDYTYLLLFIYEIINLADGKSYEYSVDLLTRIWMNYRRTYARLDSQLSEWIFDLCLIGNVKPPYKLIGDIVEKLPATAALREFFVDASRDYDGYAELLMKYCSNYDYRKSKFAVAENLPLYEKHTKGVLSFILSKSQDPSHPFDFSGLSFQDSKTTRDSFVGALCSSNMKKRIEIEYCSFSHSHELRFVVTDLLKYAENRIRAHIGVKSRLSFGSLSPKLKALADEYFDAYLPKKAILGRMDEEIPEYEKLYEPRESTLSFSAAALIEESSWQTTERLVDAFDGEAEDETVPFEVVTQLPTEPNDELSEDDMVDELLNSLCDYQLEFVLFAIQNKEEEQRRIASERFMTADVIADQINTLSADIIGDIVLEEDEDGFLVLDDYLEQIHRAITKRKG